MKGVLIGDADNNKYQWKSAIKPNMAPECPLKWELHLLITVPKTLPLAAVLAQQNECKYNYLPCWCIRAIYWGAYNIDEGYHYKRAESI